MAQCQRALMQFNLGWAITWLVGVTIYGTIFQQQFNSTWPVFMRQNIFEKKSSWGKCSLNKLLNLNSGALAPWPYMYFNSWLFSLQNKNL